MRFQAIVVPSGAEARAVEQGWPSPRPAIVAVPVGAAAGERLDAWVPGIPTATALVLGVCGALDPALRVGDAVVYARIVDAAVVGAAEVDAPETIELDAELSAMCVTALHCESATAATAAFVVGEVAAKAALRTLTGAAIVDMEAASIARALQRRGIRVAMVRVVSDDAAHDLPDLRDVYDRAGRLLPFPLAVALIRTPRRGARFIANALHALRALRATSTQLALSPAGGGSVERR